MYFVLHLCAASIALSGTMAAEMFAQVDINAVLGFDAGPDNFYNARTPPWVAGATPGWYYGPNPEKYPDLWALHETMCRLLAYYPEALHCPVPKPTPKPTTTTKTVTTTSKTTKTVTVTITVAPSPSDGYIQTFDNITAAVQADDFMTFGLVETVDDCKAMCDSVPGCTFVNSFHDVNGKGGSTDLTCSLFKFCHTSADADNAGGQSQPDGSLDFITDSDGWCKVGNAPPVTTNPAPTPTSTSSTKTSAHTSTTTSKIISTTTTKATSSTKATSTTKAKSTTTKGFPPPFPTPTGVGRFHQCGGFGYKGPKNCIPPFKCVAQNRDYYQCI